MIVCKGMHLLVYFENLKIISYLLEMLWLMFKMNTFKYIPFKQPTFTSQDSFVQLQMKSQFLPKLGYLHEILHCLPINPSRQAKNKWIYMTYIVYRQILLKKLKTNELYIHYARKYVRTHQLNKKKRCCSAVFPTVAPPEKPAM